MTSLTWGAVAGAALAFTALAFGFWGMILVAVFALVGGLIGGALSGRIDVRAGLNAARGRRVG